MWSLPITVLYIFILPGLDRSIALILASGERKPLLDCEFGSVDRPWCRRTASVSRARRSLDTVRWMAYRFPCIEKPTGIRVGAPYMRRAGGLITEGLQFDNCWHFIIRLALRKKPYSDAKAVSKLLLDVIRMHWTVQTTTGLLRSGNGKKSPIAASNMMTVLNRHGDTT